MPKVDTFFGLRRCPECGGVPEMRTITRFWVRCTQCYHAGPVRYTEEEAAQAWNREAGGDDG